ncbi:MAG: anthranilate phosphoribosyltransferase, partial [Acutalibacteraceae bacterium]
LMGVYDDKLVEPLAQVLMNLGVNKGMVVCGASKLDEATISGKNLVCEIKDGKLNTFELNPEDYGFAICTLEDLIGGTPEENAQITKDILTGALKGAKRDVVVLNTALCLYIAEKAESIQEGVALANEIIDSGKAAQQLEDFIKATNAFEA